MRMHHDRLKEIRTSTGMTQSEFAKWLGYAKTEYYARYEWGGRQAPMLLCLLMLYVERFGVVSRDDF